jgi:hypothetical protein
VTVSKSRFVGTAVVRAHAAEQCGGKGMRIFLDASLDEDLQTVRQRIRRIPLPKPLKDVRWELDFLHDPRPAAEEQKVDAADRELFDKVARLKDPQSPAGVQRQYTQTLAALNRMRTANSRKQVNLRKLRYGQPLDIQY